MANWLCGENSCVKHACGKDVYKIQHTCTCDGKVRKIVGNDNKLPPSATFPQRYKSIHSLPVSLLLITIVTYNSNG